MSDIAPAMPSAGGPISLPDPFESDVSPWLLRRLDFATRIALQLREDATRVLQSTRSSS
jgi:hypothetical protein